jgi:hypothetical protein
MDHSVRAWLRVGGPNGAKRSDRKDETALGEGKPKKIDAPKSLDASPLPLFLSGPLKNATRLPKAEVESKLGKRLCEGIKGTLEFGGHSGHGKVSMETRLHPDAPFGVVAAHWTITGEMSPGRPTVRQEWKLKLIDFGENAATEMPEAE